MKLFIKNSYLFLIFFALFFSKNFLYGLFIPEKEIEYKDAYVKKLEQELDDIKLIKKLNYKINGVYGKVLYQNPYKFNDELVIAVDSQDVSKNDYVISSKGLIGIIKKVYQNYSIVEMITSENIALQGMVSGCYGILKYNKNLYLENVNNYCKVNVGDKVYTSNLGYLDEQIVIGTIDGVIKNKSGYVTQYIVKTADDMNNLNYLLVLGES